jgi:hypothetical protein
MAATVRRPSRRKPVTLIAHFFNESYMGWCSCARQQVTSCLGDRAAREAEGPAMNTILLTAAVVALMAAVIGGGLKAFQIDVPVLETLGVRAALGVLGIAFLIAAVLLQDDPPKPAPPAAPPRSTKVACSDGMDNDSDGRTDYPNDSNCSSPDDGSERNPACSDGLDNDGDGDIDYPKDSKCSSPDDRTEKIPKCSDGLDNDHDGKTDYPDDPGCSSRDDQAEKR